MNMRGFFRPVSLAFLILPIAFGQSAKERNAATEWRTYNHDLAGEVDMTVGYGGVPTIYKNVAMVGAAVGE